MHAKSAVVDGVWSVVGSRNLDYVSLVHNQEVVVEVVGHKTGATLEEMFHDDVARSVELSLTQWKKRGMLRRLRSWLFYRIRWWL
jgi:cardiolipin synthase